MPDSNAMRTPDMLLARAATLSLIAALMLVACSKKEAVESAPAPLVTATTAAPSAPAEPIVFTGQPQPEQWMIDAQTHQEAADYDKAAQYLLAIQQQQQLLNQQQADAYWRQMSDFQANLAAQVAAGDPSAIAAAKRLRASTMR